MKALTIVGVVVALSAAAANAATQFVANSPTAGATVTVGDQTFSFKGGGCLITADSWAMALGAMADGEHLELNIPAPAERAPHRTPSSRPRTAATRTCR